MSVAATSWAWRRDDVTAIQKLVLLALCDFADARGESCWPGQRMLCKMTRLSRRAVTSALAQLEAQGMIERQARRALGQFISDSYRISCAGEELNYRNQPPCAPSAHGEGQPCAPDAHGEGQPCAPDAHGEGQPCAPDAHGHARQVLMAEIRTDPSEEDPSKEEDRARARACARSKKRPLTVWPESLELTADMRAFALERRIEPEAEFLAWRDDCEAHQRMYASWSAAWRTRIRNHVRWHSQTARGSPTLLPVVAARPAPLPTQHRLSPGMGELALQLAEVRARKQQQQNGKPS